MEVERKLIESASNPRLASALYALGLLTSENIMQVADTLMAADWDSSSLRLLAGEPNPVASEWRPLFERMLGEMGVRMPSDREAAEIISREIARMIVNRVVLPRDGAQAMWELVHEVEGFAATIGIFTELDWALDQGADPKPFPELNREEIEQRIVLEAEKLLVGQARPPAS